MDARVDERLDTLIAKVGELSGQIVGLNSQVAGLNTRMVSLEDRFRHGQNQPINWNIISAAFIIAAAAGAFTWFVSLAR